jgi:hypothetical protein
VGEILLKHGGIIMGMKVWRAKMRCQMPWRDFDRNETVELDDSQVTARVKELFDCLTPDEVKAEEEAKKEDPDFKVMVARLKAAKIPLKRGISKDEVKELFNQFLVEGATASDVAEAVK